MSEAQNLTAVIEIIEEISGIPADQVTPQKRLVDDLKIDSLALIEIAVGVGERFQVELPDEELVELRTVQDVLDRVEKETSSA